MSSCFGCAKLPLADAAGALMSAVFNLSGTPALRRPIVQIRHPMNKRLTYSVSLNGLNRMAVDDVVVRDAVK